MSKLEGEDAGSVGPLTGQLQSVVGVLRSLPRMRPLIEGMSDAALADLEASVEWFSVSGGAILFREGDFGNDAYIITAGRLGVVIETNSDMRLVAQIQPGELFGELALICREPRTATVIALRDSELVRIPGHALERLIKSSPQFMLHVIELLADRLKRSNRSLLKEATKAIAVIPIDDQILDQDFGDRFLKGFASFAPRVRLVDATAGNMTSDEIGRVEDAHDLVIYLADRRASQWSRRCLRQADRVIFVSNAGAPTDIEAEQEIAAAKQLRRFADLMILNDPDASQPTGGTKWLKSFGARHIFHARRGNAADYARIARLTTGRAVGLVLSGGGARAFAHLGVIKAFLAEGIPIDLVGGTSLGSLVAALVARDAPIDLIIEKIHHIFCENNLFNDYTLPLFSIARGRKMIRMLKRESGEITIENLWKPFFCVSTNLSNGRAMMHEQGALWRGLRSSTAVPGIFPPWVENEEVLVDGAVLNNFPTAEMRALQRGPVIGIEVAFDETFRAKALDIEEKSLLWRMTRGRREMPSLLRILMRSGMVNSELQTAASRAAADVLIQPDVGNISLFAFRQDFAKAVDAGFRAATEALPRIRDAMSGRAR